MKTKTHYYVLTPLINELLTGKKVLDTNKSILSLSVEYLKACKAREELTDKANVYQIPTFYNFLENLSYREKKDIINIFLENSHLITMAFIGKTLLDKNSFSPSIDYEDEFNSIIYNYLRDNEVNPLIFEILFLYLDNIYDREPIKESITLDEYESILLYNSRARSAHEF